MLLLSTPQVENCVADLVCNSYHLIKESFGERARDMGLVIGDVIIKTAVTFVELREPVVRYFDGRIEGIGGVEVECKSEDPEVAGNSEGAEVEDGGDNALDC